MLRQFMHGCEVPDVEEGVMPSSGTMEGESSVTALVPYARRATGKGPLPRTGKSLGILVDHPSSIFSKDELLGEYDRLVELFGISPFKVFQPKEFHSRTGWFPVEYFSMKSRSG